MKVRWQYEGFGLWSHPFERELAGLPVITETPQNIYDFYQNTGNFISVLQYGRDIEMLPNEIGCLVLAGDGDRMLPVLRVCKKSDGEFAEEVAHRCVECGSELELVRPGKYQCPKCG